MSAQPVNEEPDNLPARTDKRRFIVVGKDRIPKPAQARMEAAKERQMRALDLRKARVTYDQIAVALGYADAGSARKAVLAALRRQEFELAKDVVLLDLQTLDELQMRCTEAVRKGDLFQVDRILRIMTQRYQLAGVGSRTVDELQEQMGIVNPAAVQNNGVMVINAQAGTSDFVRAMMSAVGVDPESPVYAEKLKELESGTPSPVKGRTVKRKKIKKSAEAAQNSSVEHTTIEKPLQVDIEDEEIIDAEIIEDDVDE